MFTSALLHISSGLWKAGSQKGRQQCDQIRRNFVTLATKIKSLTILKRFIKSFSKC